MTSSHNRSLDLLREIGLVAAGLVLAVVPLALWVTWSETSYYVVLTVCALGAVVFVALSRTGPPEEAPPAGANSEFRRTLSPEWISELQSLQPLTYHHRSLGDGRLRNKFRRLRQLMRQSGD